jgi:hypothetical protein
MDNNTMMARSKYRLYYFITGRLSGYVMTVLNFWYYKRRISWENGELDGENERNHENAKVSGNRSRLEWGTSGIQI